MPKSFFKKATKPRGNVLGKLRAKRPTTVRHVSWRCKLMIRDDSGEAKPCNKVNPVDKKHCGDCGKPQAEGALALDQDEKVVGSLVRHADPDDGEALFWSYDSAKKRAEAAEKSDGIIRFED